jgi:hypothetical protein
MANDMNVGGLGGSRPHKPTTQKRQAVGSIIGPTADRRPPTVADIGSPVVGLLSELTGIPLPVCASLVVERLDTYGDCVLDAEWAKERARLWPQAVRSAHSRHAGTSYAARRAQELADVRPHLRLVGDGDDGRA